MRIPTRLYGAAAAAALVTAALAFASGASTTGPSAPQDRGHGDHDGHGHGHDHDDGHGDGHEEGELEEAMYGLKKHLKGLATALADPAGEAAALEHVTDMQRIALAAKLLEPANLADIPAAERTAHEMDFRREMVGLLKELAELELDVLDGKRDGAMKRVRESLLEIRERAHDKFQKDE